MDRPQPTPAPRLVAGTLAAGLAVVAWGCPSVIAKALPIDALPLVFYRGWIGVVWGVGALYLAGGKLDRRVLRFSMLGGIALGFDLIFFFTAIKLTTVANATVIGALQPVLLVFAAPWLFGERIRWPDVGAATLAIGGVVLVAYGSATDAAWGARGDFYAVLTLFAWTAYLIASKAARRMLRALEFTAGVSIIASILVTPFALLSGPLVRPAPLHWLGLVAMAITGWSGHVLMNWSLAHIPLWVGGSAALAVPVIASLAAAVFLGESFLPIQGLGMAIVLGALTAVVLRTPRVLA